MRVGCSCSCCAATQSVQNPLQMRQYLLPYLQSRLDDVERMQQQHSRRTCHATSDHMLPALALRPLRCLLLVLLLGCMVFCLLFGFFGGHAAAFTGSRLEGEPCFELCCNCTGAGTGLAAILLLVSPTKV